MNFFDKHDIFLKTSTVGAWPERLNARYRAIIDDNKGLIEGARVLDIASHDGRWSFAALDAGAAHVTGIEVRPELVEAANKNFEALGVSPGRYTFKVADVFESEDLRKQQYDLVLCLGFFYHTTRHVELLHRIDRLDAKVLILDTMLLNRPGNVCELRSEPVSSPANGLDEEGVREGQILVAHPTAAAVHMMLRHFGYEVRQTNWQTLISDIGASFDANAVHSATNPLGDYGRGLRGTFVAARF